MSILIVAPSGLGGIQISAARLADGFCHFGWQVHVLFETYDTLNHQNLPLPNGVTSSTITNSSHNSLYYNMKRMACFIENGGFSVIYPNTSSIAYRALGFLGKKRPIAIGGCHGDNSHDYACISEFAHYLDHIYAVSSRCAIELRKRLMNYTVEVSVAHNATTLAPQLPKHATNGKLEMAYAGRLDHGKRINNMISVAIKLRAAGINFKFTIAGDGPLRGELASLVKKNGLDNVICFIGRCSIIDIGHLMARSHINLLMSESEGFGLSVLDGMICGSVPIVTEVCGCVDAIEHGLNGFVVGVGDIDGVVSLIIQMNEDRDLLALMGREAQRSACEMFSQQDEIRKHINIINSATEHHHDFSSISPPWKYNSPGFLDHPVIPNCITRITRRLRYGH